ncbi:MAG: FtsX-like permease family protein, partial [Planctomycetota bacterium JB042]
NASAVRTFAAGVTAVTGEVDLIVRANRPSFREDVFPTVLGTEGVAAAKPRVGVEARLVGGGDPWVDVVGVDLLGPAELPLEGEPPSPADLLAGGGWSAVSGALLDAADLAVGDRFRVTSGTRTIDLVVGARLDPERRGNLGADRLVVLDVAEAQRRLGRRGELDRIDVEVRGGADVERVRERLQARLPPGLEARTPGEEGARAGALLEAFRMNLTALSLVSVFVGVFLVYASLRASLVRRRRELGVLRALGAGRGQVLGVILAEVALVGALGTALGVVLGWQAAASQLGAVSRTMTSLYLLDEVRELVFPPSTIALGALVGIGGSILGALGPALELVRRDPMQLLHVGGGDGRPARAIGRTAIGLLLPAVGFGWAFAVGLEDRRAGFVIGLAVLLALPLLAPALLALASRSVRRPGFGVGYALRALDGRSGSAATAIAGLAAAAAMLFGVTAMVESFRDTVRDWVARSIRADVYVATKSWARGVQDAELDDDVVARLAAFEGVAAIDRLRKLHVWVGDHRLSVVGVDWDGVPAAAARFPLLSGDEDDALAAVRAGRACLLGEPSAAKLGVAVGDVLRLPGGDGAVVEWPVAGIHEDYTSEFGTAVVSLPAMERAYGPATVNSMSLYLEDGVDPDRTIDALRGAFDGVPLTFTSNARLRREVDRIFDETFVVTRLLQAMSLTVAACAVALTLLVMARERRLEIALYRSIGATRGQVFRLFLAKGAGIALLGVLLGGLGGAGLFFVLTQSINRAWFGWTIRGTFPAGTLALQVATIAAVVLVASLRPAWKAGETPATELCRED